MKPEYLQKIESLEHEVKDFHPILMQLFPRLPSISKVEYKQGPNEKGADFVLIKVDESLGEETYIGVICKVGKITQSSTEVERQIDECKTYSRFIQSGTKKIFLNEVWVVNNSTISANAEEKFHEKYKGSNIKFVNGEKVVQLISKHYSEFWEYNSINYGQYFSQLSITMQSGVDSSFFGNIGINQFIDQRIIKESGRKQKNKPELIFNVIKNERYIFIEGCVGSGKSTLLRHLVDKLKLAIEIEPNTTPIPIFFQYKDVVKNNLDIHGLILKTLELYNLPIDKDIIFIIDSVDEYNESSENRIENFKTIVNNVSNLDNVKLIVTSRTIDSLVDYEATDRLFTRYSILPLSIGQIVNFVDKICNNIDITKKLQNGIEKTPLFKSIPRTPISAILLARILNDEIKELPSTITELYSKYTEIVLGRWDTSKGLLSQTEYDIMKNVLMDVADYMMTNSLNFISVREVEDIYLNYISKRNLNIDEEKIFSRLIEKSEVAYLNEKNKTFSFIHRSFMEYFYAEKMKKNNSVSIDESIYDMYWANSYFFYFGLLRDSEEMLTLLNEMKISSDKNRVLKLLYNGSFLLAAYLTPYDKIKEGVLSSFIDAGKLIEDILKGNTDSPLINFPPVTLLCIFTRCLSNNYSYDFFRNALQYSLNEIDKTSELGDFNEYSKFFIASCLNELGERNSFNGLAENKNLDLLIKLGIKHVTEDTGIINQTVDKIIKKHHKQRRKNYNLSSYINSLYNESSAEILYNKR